MSAQNTNFGCGLWMILIVAFFAFLAFTSGTRSLTLNQQPITTTATPLPPVLTITIVPETTDKYFVLENNLITYTYSKNLGRPCYYEMTGHVRDINGQPYSKFIVNIKMLNTEMPPELGYAFPGEGGNIEDGVSGWGSLLPQDTVRYEIWLTDKIGGVELSPHIIVPPQGCDHNLATINFVQVKPIPS